MPERAEKMTKSFSVFDCDGHINEPVTIWRDYVEPEYRDAVRRTYWRDEQQAIINGRTDVRAGVRDKSGLPYHEGTVGGPGINKKLIRRFQSMRLTEEQKQDLDHKGAYDPHARLKDMDVMGIDQAVIIPTQLVNTALYCEDLKGLRGLSLALTAFGFFGHMEDYPKLKLAFSHSGAAWVPLALEKIETRLTLNPPINDVTLEPERLFLERPSLTVFDSWETSVPRMLDFFEDVAAWGSRYPQHDTSPPQEALEVLAQYGAPDKAVRKLMGGNAARFLGI